MADAATAGTNVVHKDAVVIDYEDLIKPVGDLKEKIKAAFGCVKRTSYSPLCSNF